MALDANILLQQGPSAVDVALSKLAQIQNLYANQQSLQQSKLLAPLQRAQLAQSIQQSQQLAPLQQSQLQQSILSGQRTLQSNKLKSQRLEVAEGLQSIKPFVDSGDLAGAAKQLDNLNLSPEIAKSLKDGLNDTPENVKKSLDAHLNALKNIGISAGASQFGAQQTFKDSKGNLYFGTTKRNPLSGDVVTTLSPIGNAPDKPVGKVEVTGSYGLTAGEKVNQVGAETTANTEAKSNEQRVQDALDQGLTASDTIPVLKRSLELLKTVSTGGFSGALIKAGQYFGVTGADSGELSYNLAKNVLSQLKNIFGNAFTSSEGDKLDAIEAGITKSPEVNARLLTQALRIAEKKSNTALSIAKGRKNTDLINLINTNLNFSLSEKPANSAVDLKNLNTSELKNLNNDDFMKSLNELDTLNGQ